MHTVDSRITNIVKGMKENEIAIQHIQQQLYTSFRSEKAKQMLYSNIVEK